MGFFPFSFSVVGNRPARSWGWEAVLLGAFIMSQAAVAVAGVLWEGGVSSALPWQLLGESHAARDQGSNF